jgi:hypothetical protein
MIEADICHANIVLKNSLVALSAQSPLRDASAERITFNDRRSADGLSTPEFDSNTDPKSFSTRSFQPVGFSLSDGPGRLDSHRGGIS